METLEALADRGNDVAALAREIGADVPDSVDVDLFGAQWAKELARVVGQFGAYRSKYPLLITDWCTQIDEAEPASVRVVMEEIRQEISGIDCDDGWATDRAGSAVESVCLSLQPGTRWMAHAGDHVWKFATCSAAYNDVTRISMHAWLRHVFDIALRAHLLAQKDHTPS